MIEQYEKKLSSSFRLAALAVPAGLQAQQLSYQTLDDPNASASSGGTMAQGVSAGRNVVGTYFDGSGVAHGFLYDGDSYVSLDEPTPWVALMHRDFWRRNRWLLLLTPARKLTAFSMTAALILRWTTPTPFLIMAVLICTSAPYATGVSDGNIVGYYLTINGQTHGFLR